MTPKYCVRICFKEWLHEDKDWTRNTKGYSRGAAWIDTRGKIYHCGLSSHAKVFQQLYKGRDIDPSKVKDCLDDVHAAVEKSNWIRVLAGNFDVKRIDGDTLRRISNFLMSFPQYQYGRMRVEDSEGNGFGFGLDEIPTLDDKASEKSSLSWSDRILTRIGVNAAPNV